MIPYGKQSIDQTDIDAVVDVLKSDWLTQGPKVPAFEDSVASYCEAKHGVAVNSATSALHIACLALDVGKGDIVWTSPISFVASANCALYCGAKIDFVDIDLNTGNMSVLELEKKLLLAKKNNCLPKVVIPVHLAGQSCDMQAIHKLAHKYDFKIIEDASHAIGAKYLDKPVGNCEFSDICIFSFHPVKIITSAEGGMAVTNSDNLAKRLKRLRSHGLTTDPTEMTEPSHGPWYYQQIELGFNYRMTDLHAALGMSQLSKVDEFVNQRHFLAKTYDAHLDLNLIRPLQQSNTCYSAYHLYIVQLKNSDIEQHKNVITQLRAAGIIGHLHYIPIHLQPYYKAMGFSAGDFPNAEKYYQRAITLPLHPALQDHEVYLVINTLHQILN
ncbi:MULTISPECIES: UDP-4-amino-4,6-dideoxy-N-acetyl-beta-L-altrosamine transaminase [unclassified Pseudoalteromonas]|uniref:UDP-4-amino-4, 6-dideoxy-N-acetyl-beta-L-altrosamine transaminase n=1 Tax=unclassified Pseudoalteromonas TaxID=194690 RepID=UPI000C06B157|nr:MULTISPECIES: UDP-4-amino-4,6-dideoxy-N-acetyl-beta-L-altrosamine transaminase [unclassified Pseudoalteromonas]MDP2635459.1 UDP-4-amino-4,6-dideoxy-N-acetyl-beta-L-altrosamine transaminase [Pseudoalteromonas sp. 1_MG-2023]PHN88803.1 UDP-4-amino-4,6-dideoxy-N-acetyl-beta-L-altrosamine transaminase [Pseudoalteromonas sp. 3D05]